METKKNTKENLQNNIDSLKKEAAVLLTEEQVKDILGITKKKELEKAKEEYQTAKEKKKALRKVKNLQITKNILRLAIPVTILLVGNIGAHVFRVESDLGYKQYQYTSQVYTSDGDYFEESTYNKMKDYTVTIIETKNNTEKIYIVNSNSIDPENKGKILSAKSYEELQKEKLLGNTKAEITYLKEDKKEDGTQIFFSQNTKNKENYIITKAKEERKEELKAGIPIGFGASLVTFFILEMLEKWKENSSMSRTIINYFKDLKEQNEKIKDLGVKEKRKLYKKKEKEYKKRGN